MEVGITYLILLGIVGLFVPVMAIVNRKKTGEYLETHPESKPGFYTQTIFMLLITAAVTLGVMAWNQDPFQWIGLDFLNDPIKVSAILIGPLLFIGLLKGVILNLRKLDDRTTRNLNEVMFLLPATQKEYRLSIVMSYSAGIAEEIIYRGFIYTLFLNWMTVIPAILLTNIIFGVSHSATGLKNSLYSFGLGVFWSITFYLTGSIWLAILTHILVDVFSMTQGYKFQSRVEATE